MTARNLTPVGTVGVRNFDQGVVETMGGVVFNQHYYLPVQGVPPPPLSPELPGVPVTFAFPEDVFERFRMPVVLVKRDDIAPAMERWHPTTLQYRAPTATALPVQVTVGGNSLDGFDRYEEVQQATPFDLNYQISIFVGPAAGARTLAQLIFLHILKAYPPYAVLKVKDSLGELRTYDAFMDGTQLLDDLSEITGRVVGFSLSLRINGELDLSDPETSLAVTSLPTKHLTVKH